MARSEDAHPSKKAGDPSCGHAHHDEEHAHHHHPDPVGGHSHLHARHGDHNGHDHAGHGHHDPLGPPPSMGRALAVGIGLNLLFVIVEVAAGIWASSTALIADAAHNLGDVLGLVLAWGAQRLAERRPTSRHTYGLGRGTLLSALANSLLLVLVVGGILWEATIHWSSPRPVVGGVVAVTAGIGVLINGSSALLLLRGSHGDLNVRGAFLHLVSDALVSLAVLGAGLVVHLTGWVRIDLLVSVVVSLVILGGTWSLLNRSIGLLLDRVPDRIDPSSVQAYLASLPGVEEVHDLHIWSLSSTEVALTAHLVMPWGECPPPFLVELPRVLEARFGIGHPTVQIEPSGVGAECKLASSEVV